MRISKKIEEKLRSILSKGRSANLTEGTLLESLIDHLANPLLRGHPKSPYQRPSFFFSPLSQTPWIEPANYSRILAAVTKLESNFPQIASELRNLNERDSRSLAHLTTTDLSSSGKWNAIMLRQGGVNFRNVQLVLPKTTAVIDELPGLGELAFVSRLRSSGEIAPHCGAWNLRLNIHLGIDIPADSGISVGGEQKKWEEGKCLVFDDSFEHYIWNHGKKNRTVLVVNTWHPDLPDSDIPTLEHLARAITESENLTDV